MNPLPSPYYGWQGEPITQEQWSRLFADNRHIGSDRIGDTEVSTVWIGLDMGFGFGPPMIFETMIFGGAMDGECWRYSTERDAREGHARVVAEVHALTL